MKMANVTFRIFFLAFSTLIINVLWGGVARALPSQSNPCDSVQAEFFSSNVYAEPGEAVLFTNTSENFTHCQWFIDDSLVATSINLSYTFNAENHYDVRLDVFDSINNCSNSFELIFSVKKSFHFIDEFEKSNQNSGECACLTTMVQNQNGGIEEITNYRWSDRWGNKYCNLSISGNCEENYPLEVQSITSVPPAFCEAGFFNLYFTETSDGTNTYAFTQSEKELMCQVFADIAEAITPGNMNATVNILIEPNNYMNALGVSGSFYDLYPQINNAIVHGNVWKAINTTSTNPSLYHGYVYLNSELNYYSDYDPAGISTGELDLYAITQHLALHCLGYESFFSTFSGDSYFVSNDLYTVFDQNLAYDNDLILTNIGPGMNYQASSYFGNCQSLRFQNSNAISSPVNGLLSGDFQNPSHLDDACSNIGSTPAGSINSLYVMNPFFFANEARRMQQEELSVLCKIGYEITGNYGTSSLSVGGNNPNVRNYEPCINTGLDRPLIANDDIYTAPFQYYSSNCPGFNGPYSIEILGNDIFPNDNNTVIVDLFDIQSNALVPQSNYLNNGFTFTPNSGGLHLFVYRLLHTATGLYSNYGVVAIYVSYCEPINCTFSDPSSCNLICNSEMDRVPCEDVFALPSNYSEVEGWRSTGGTVTYLCASNLHTSLVQNSGFIQIGAHFSVPGSTTNGQGSTISGSEYFGQDIVLNQNVQYLASFYYSRFNEIGDPDATATIRFDYTSEANLPTNVGYNFFNIPPQDLIYETEIIDASNEGIWKQAVSTFTPTTTGNLVQFGVNLVSGQNTFFGHLVDRVELIEDNFTAGEDQNILCGESFMLNAPCMDITNLQYAWYELDDFGNVVGPPLAMNSNVLVSPTSTTTYRLIRYIANLNELGNNGYFVENASSLYAEDDVTIFVDWEGTCGYSVVVDPMNCAHTFTSDYQNGTHFWDFGDGTTSTDVNPTHVYANNGFYYVTHTITEFGCECTISEQIFVFCCNNSNSNITTTQCSGSEIILPEMSSSGIQGVWSPTPNNLQTTTYTFTPNDINCNTTFTLTIVIEPQVTPQFAPIAPLCNGALNLTLPSTSLNGISGTWNLTSWGTSMVEYTFTPDPDQCAEEVSLNIPLIQPTIPVFEPVSAICQGDIGLNLPTTSLNGISGFWSPSINNQQTTTYTFTPDVGQCASITYLTIEVLIPITPTFNPVNPMCQNISFSLPLLSTNGIDGSWTPAFSSANLGTTVYTFTPLIECYPTVTMEILIIDCGSCTNAPGIQLSGVIDENLAPGFYRIVDDVEINGQINAYDCVFAIDPNVSLTIPNGSALNLSASHLYGCHALWDGIDVEETGKLTLRACLIEDARIAVDVKERTSPGIIQRLKSDFVIFNKNLTGIQINGYPFDNANSVFVISSTAFTSRIIASSPGVWPEIAVLLAPNPVSNANNAENPFIIPWVYFATGSLPLMNTVGTLSPAPSGVNGILLFDVGLTDGSQFHAFNLGLQTGSYPLVFDRMNFGINSVRSNLVVENCVFQGFPQFGSSFGVFGRGDNGPAMGYTPYEGRIVVQNTGENPNLFYNLSRAADVRGYSHFIFNDAIIRTNRQSINPILGEVGIRFQSYRTVQFQAKNNIMHNVDRGVYCLIAKQQNVNLDLDVSFNTIAKGLPALTGVVPSHGISILGINPGNNFTVSSSNPVKINTNQISGVRNGIDMQNFVNTRFINIRNNNITLAPQSSSLADLMNESILYNGIWLRNITTNKSFVSENSISGFNATLGNSRAIRAENATSFAFTCNVTNNTRGGLYFFGNCTGRVRDNSMSNHKYGLWLDAGGVIGFQGNATTPSNNKWEGTWSNFGGTPPPTPFTNLRIKTYVSGQSFANFSRLYVNSQPITNPLDSWAWEDFSNLAYSSNPDISTITFYPTSNPCSSSLLENDENEISEETVQSMVEGFEQNAIDSSGIDSEISLLIKEYLTYDQLYRDSILKDSVLVLEEFYLENEMQNMGLLREIEDKIEDHDFSGVDSLYSLVVVDNIIEQAYSEVLDLTVQYEMGLFNSTDSLNLWVLANSCYYLNGKATPMAQNLYNTIYSTTVVFDEDCPLILPKSARIFDIEEPFIELELYPNPNSAVLYVNSSNSKLKESEILIRDAFGKVVFEGSIHFLRGLNLQELNLSTGVYHIEFLISEIDGEFSRFKKLVYIKE